MKNGTIKAGQKVYIKSVKRCRHGIRGLMEANVGKIVNVLTVIRNRDGQDAIYLKNDPCGMAYSANCFSPVETLNINGKECFVIPTERKRLSLDELIEEGLAIAREAIYYDVRLDECIVVLYNTSRYKVGIAHCRADDFFNDEVGIALAAFRAAGKKGRVKELLELI